MAEFPTVKKLANKNVLSFYIKRQKSVGEKLS